MAVKEWCGLASGAGDFSVCSIKDEEDDEWFAQTSVL